MNPNDIVKFLEEDEDETMHSVEGNSSITEHHSDSNSELQPIKAQVLDHDEKPDKEMQMNKLENTSHHQVLPTGKGNPQTMTSSSHQSGATSKFSKISVGTLLPVLQAQLDKDRTMQLNALHNKLMKNEISNDDFFRHMRSIAGDEMLKLAVLKLQTQAARNSHAPNQAQSQPQPSESQLQVPSGGENPSSSQRDASETTTNSSSQMPSVRPHVGRGNNSKALPRKPLVGQKKLVKVPGSLPPSSKKQKVSGSFDDPSIEQLNDVTAVSGVNIKEEEEQLLSISKKDSQFSESFRRIVQEEEERQILQKIPLQKLMMEIMAGCGLKNMSDDAQRCLSLLAEEKIRGLISNAIRVSKQVHKEEDDKMRATAANVAVGATTAVGDIASRCQLMIEVKQEKGEYNTSTDPQTNKDGGQKKPSVITEGNTRKNQDSEKRDPPVALTTPGELHRSEKWDEAKPS